VAEFIHVDGQEITVLSSRIILSGKTQVFKCFSFILILKSHLFFKSKALRPIGTITPTSFAGKDSFHLKEKNPGCTGTQGLWYSMTTGGISYYIL